MTRAEWNAPPTAPVVSSGISYAGGQARPFVSLSGFFTSLTPDMADALADQLHRHAEQARTVSNGMQSEEGGE